MTLFIHLLGPPSLSLDATPFKFTAPPKTLPLLAYLLLHRDQLVERQQVAFTLWPDDPESVARGKLRRHIHQLQHALPPATQPWLLGDARTVGWNPQADYWLDVAEFERLSGQPECLVEAAACYTGDLLETNYDDWIFYERERLVNQYYDVLTRLIYQHRTRRDYPTAIGYAQHLLRRDPFREDTLRQLISLRYEAGDRAGAIQEYESFARRLHQEMDVTPMPETQVLLEIILHNGRLPGAATPLETDCVSAPRAHPGLPFVGREKEIAQLSARWHRAAHGHGGLTLIGGEAGVGKTRLVHEFAMHVEQQGGRVLFGHTTPGEHAPYQAITEALQSAIPLLAAVESNQRHLSALASLIPSLMTRFPLPALPPLDPEKERLRLFDALATCLIKLTEPRPLLLILEDLHWAGKASLALTEFLTHRAATSPLLILGTYRDEETPRLHPLRHLRHHLKSENLVEHLPLHRLPQPAVTQLLARWDGNLPASPETPLATRLFTESEGNPLFAELLLQHWQEQGDTTQDVPGSVRAAITRRLKYLPDEAHAYAEVAAVFGPAFDAEAVREIGGWDEARAFDALGLLLDGRLVQEARGRFDHLFAHHLIQATLYEAIPLAKRKRRHLRAAEVLEELYPDQREEMAGELAAHFDQGGALEQAIACYRLAAQSRLKVYADAEALAALDRALALTEILPAGIDPDWVFDLWKLRESLHYRRGERDEQAADLQALEACAEGKLAWMCEVSRRYILYHKGKDERLLQKKWVETLKAQAKALGSQRWIAEAVFSEGNYLKTMDEYPAAMSLLQEALALYEEIGDRNQQVICCCLLAEILIILRHSCEAEAWTQRALALCEGEAPTYQLLNTLWSLSAQRLLTKDLDGCLHYSHRLLEMAERAGDRVWQAAAHRLIGMTFQRQFRIAEARERLHMALSFYQQSQKPKGCALTLQTLGHVEVSLGNYAGAMEAYQQAYEIHEKLNDPNGMASELLNLAFAASHQEDYAAEQRYSQQGLLLTRQLGNRHLEAIALQNLGESEREMGEFQPALQHLHEAWALLDDPSLLEERTSVLADLALAYWKANDLPSALDFVEKVLTHYPQIQGEDDNLHRYLWVGARILHAAGQAERAAQVLSQAYNAFKKDLTAIPDADSRQAYLLIRHNRQIATAYEYGEWV